MEEKFKDENFMLAIILSLVVGIVGAIIWGVVYYLGYYASIVSLFSAYGMVYIFGKFSNKSKFSYIWTVIISTILNCLACFIALIIEIKIAYACDIKTAMDIIVVYWPTLSTSLIIDWAMSALFTIIGVVGCISSKMKEIKRLAIIKNQQQDIETEPVTKIDGEDVDTKNINS